MKNPVFNDLGRASQIIFTVVTILSVITQIKQMNLVEDKLTLKLRKAGFL